MKTDKDYFASYLKSQTAREAERMKKGGMTQISRAELINLAAAIGYEIDQGSCFNYVNNSNLITYKARSIGWRHKASGLPFAHMDAPRDTLPQLQKIRFHHFVVHNGRIWEL